MSFKNALLTGASGFVGSHVLQTLLEQTDWDVYCPMTSRHQGNSERVAEVLRCGQPSWAGRVHTFLCDLACGIPATLRWRLPHMSYILNVASSSGVEDSIRRPAEFIRNNVELMSNVLDFAVQTSPETFLHMGTDEEYGQAPPGYAHVEWDAIAPSNPYAASKAAQSAMAISAWRTYGIPVILTRTMNLIGPMQSAEKLVPTVIRAVLAGDEVPIYASPDLVPGSRCWIDVREFGSAWLHLLEQPAERWPDAERPPLWHIVGQEYSNLEVAQMIADALHRPLRYRLVPFHASRPGHDLRYALNGDKLATAGWEPLIPIEDTIRDTVSWYMDNRQWLSLSGGAA